MIFVVLDSHFYSQLYKGYVQKEGENACAPLLNFTKNLQIGEHPDSVLMKAALNSLDPNWRDHLGFFDIDYYSIPWYDLHPEGKLSFAQTSPRLLYSLIHCQYPLIFTQREQQVGAPTALITVTIR